MALGCLFNWQCLAPSSPRHAAGYYYGAGAWWWFDAFESDAWAPHWWPTVEGPIAAIARFPDYAPTTLSNGLTVLYWGGPALGLNHTTADLPAGATVRAHFDAPGVWSAHFFLASVVL